MKTRWLTLMVIAVLMGGAQAHAQEGRIVYVNLDKVFSEFYRTKIADQQLTQQAEEFNVERRELVEQFEGLNERFNAARAAAQDAALSEEVRTRSRNEAEDLLVQIREFEGRIQEFDQTRRQQLEEQGRRMRTRIVEEIRTVIQRHARSQGYQAVIDSSGQSMNVIEVVLYHEARLDITDAILEILNEGR